MNARHILTTLLVIAIIVCIPLTGAWPLSSAAQADNAESAVARMVHQRLAELPAAQQGAYWSEIFDPRNRRPCQRPRSGQRQKPLRWRLIHKCRQRVREQHRQVGWQRLVRPGRRHERLDVCALAVDGAGNLYAGGDFTSAGACGEPHRQVGRQRLVCPGQRVETDEPRPCPGGGRRRQPLCRGRVHRRRRRGGEQYRQVGRQRLVRPGQRDRSGSGRRMPWQWTAPATSTPEAAFTTAGGVRHNNIAKWDGSAWSALGSGIMTPRSMPWRWTAPATSMPAAIHHRWWRGGKPHRQVGRQRLVCPGQLECIGNVYALAVDDAGNLYAGGTSLCRRRGSKLHRQVGWQRLVCPGQRDPWRQSSFPGSERRRQPLCRRRRSRLQAACR